MAIDRDDFDAVDDASARQPVPERTPATTAKTVAAFSSRPLQTKLRAAMRAGTLRHAWRLSDGREVLLTERLCHVHDGRRVYSAPYPSSAGTGMAVQCVMAVERGRDPFAGGERGEEKKR